MNACLSFTGAGLAGRVSFPAEKLTCRRGVNASNAINTMGDRSPKSNQKKSSQKQAKANRAEQMKQQAITAKQAIGKKN